MLQRSYLNFCWFALKERVTSRGRKLIKITLSILGLLITWVLSTLLGVPLTQPLKWIYHLLPGLLWLVVALLVLILFLLQLMEGGRRLYERTLRELDKAMKFAEKLGRIHGVGETIYLRCSPDSTQPLPKKELQMWVNSIENTLRDEFGEAGIAGFYKGAGDNRSAPGELAEQEQWVGDYLKRLHNFICQQRASLIIHRSTERTLERSQS